MEKRLLLTIFIALLLLSAITIRCADATDEQGGFQIEFQPIYINYSMKYKNPSVQPDIASFGNNLEVKKVTDAIFHIRQKTWDDFFLSADIENKKLFEVTEGVFGTKSGKAELIHDASVNTVNQPGEAPENFFVHFGSPGRLIIKDGKAQFSAKVSESHYYIFDDLTFKKVSPTLYHIRPIALESEGTGGVYWEADLEEKILKYVTLDPAYGLKRSTKGFPQSGARVITDELREFASNTTKSLKQARISPALKIPEDSGLSSSAQARKGKWSESQKNIYRSILKRGRYDVLIVPFQVQGHAVDRANRSLMTRYLSKRIEDTGLSVPDPTIVDRALGEGARRLELEDIYRLADELNVRKVVFGYVGHNLDETMNLTIFVHTKIGDGFSPSELRRHDWRNIAFSDGAPPSESFRQRLEDVFSRLSVSGVMEPRKPFKSAKMYLKLPEKPSEVFGMDAGSLANAHFLQALGVLYPDEGSFDYPAYVTEREALFERSLVALQGVSPESPDYRLLKARAMFFLHSRPAALKSLGTPKTDEEKAFFAFLNGNLKEAEKYTEAIKSPIHKLMAQIELNDMREFYGIGTDAQRHLKTAMEYKGWEPFVFRRLTGRDNWNIQPNAAIKGTLDEEFPTSVARVDVILKELKTKGAGPDSVEIDLAAYKHFIKAAEDGAKEFAFERGSASLTRLDYLNLLNYTSELNSLKKLRHLVFVKGMYDEATELFKSYDVYDDNVRFLFLKSVLLTRLQEIRPSGESANIRLMIKETEEALCRRAQGQTDFSSCAGQGPYSTDYPSRNGSGADRASLGGHALVATSGLALPEHMKKFYKGFEIEIMYSSLDYGGIIRYYNSLMSNHFEKEAAKLLDAVKDRFNGNPQKIAFLAELSKKTGDVEAAAALYENLDSSNTEDCTPYQKKAGLLFYKGDYKSAFEVLKKFPLYAQKDGDRLVIANCSNWAGLEFYKRGAVDKAAYFFEIASKTSTGAAAEYIGTGFLNLFDGDYDAASESFLRLGQRYGNIYGHMYYASLMHATGRPDKGWESFNAFRDNSVMLIPALVGFRMKGKKEDEQMEYLRKSGVQREQAEAYALLAYTMDRESDFAGALRQAYWDFTEPDKRTFTKDSLGTPLIAFADGYGRFVKKDFKGSSEAFLKFKDAHLKSEYSYSNYSFALPYLARSLTKTGRAKELKPYLDSLRSGYGKGFYLSLASAIFEASDGRHDTVIKSLRASLDHMDNIWSYPLMRWYQLVEVCEWLYEDTKDESYRALAVELAKTHQKMAPMMAWAYAVEARYSKNPDDRSRALAAALYLDKRSARIAGISDSEKKEALKRLEVNNPFTGRPKSAKGKA